MLNPVAREQYANYAAVKARIATARVIVAKPKGRPFRPSLSAVVALAGEASPSRTSLGPLADAHILAYRAHCYRPPSYPPVSLIVQTVADLSGVRPIEILSARRQAQIVLPRQVCMYIARTHTLASFPEIGRRMGGRDHTTALHGSNKVRDRLQRQDVDVCALVRAVEERLRVFFPGLGA